MTSITYFCYGHQSTVHPFPFCLAEVFIDIFVTLLDSVARHREHLDFVRVVRGWTSIINIRNNWYKITGNNQYLYIKGIASVPFQHSVPFRSAVPFHPNLIRDIIITQKTQKTWKKNSKILIFSKNSKLKKNSTFSEKTQKFQQKNQYFQKNSKF